MKALAQVESILENKFALEEEVRFRALMRRTRLLGRWVGKLIGCSDPETYAEELIDSYLAVPNENAIVDRLHQDLENAKIGVSRHDIRMKMVELLFIPANEG